jgi:hypothetical protein
MKNAIVVFRGRYWRIVAAAAALWMYLLLSSTIYEMRRLSSFFEIMVGLTGKYWRERQRTHGQLSTLRLRLFFDQGASQFD